MAAPRACVWSLVAGIALLMSRSAGAQDVPPPPVHRVEAGVESDLGSRYLFRGLVFSTGPVTQSKAWVSWGNLQAYGWTNVAVPAAPGARTLDEVDAGASYAIERAGLAAVPALDVYMYRLSVAERASGVPTYTIEASLALSYTRGGTTVSVKQVVDAGSYRGARFAQVGASYARQLTPRATFEVTALVGWASRKFNHSYIGPDRAAVALATAGVSVIRRVGRHAYLRPHAEVSIVPDAQLRGALARPANVVLGLAIGVVR